MKQKHLIFSLLLLLLGSWAMEAQTNYGFRICDVNITSENIDKLGRIAGVTVSEGGHIIYEGGTRTLKMKGVALRHAFTCLVTDPGAAPLTLALEGENNFESERCCEFFSDMRITGPGKLSVVSQKDAIWVSGGTVLTISDGCFINVLSQADEDGFAAINGSWQQESRIIIQNATVHAKAIGIANAPYPYAIGGFTSITSEGAEITMPVGGKVANYSFSFDGSDYNKAFIMDGEKPATEVKIEKVLSAEGVEITALRLYPNPADTHIRLEGAKPRASIAIYSMDGVRLLTAAADESGVADLAVSALLPGNYAVTVGGQALRLVVSR